MVNKETICPSFERIHDVLEHRTEQARRQSSQDKTVEFEIRREIDLSPIIAVGLESPHDP